MHSLGNLWLWTMDYDYSYPPLSNVSFPWEMFVTFKDINNITSTITLCKDINDQWLYNLHSPNSNGAFTRWSQHKQIINSPVPAGPIRGLAGQQPLVTSINFLVNTSRRSLLGASKGGTFCASNSDLALPSWGDGYLHGLAGFLSWSELSPHFGTSQRISPAMPCR